MESQCLKNPCRIGAWVFPMPPKYIPHLYAVCDVLIPTMNSEIQIPLKDALQTVDLAE